MCQIRENKFIKTGLKCSTFFDRIPPDDFPAAPALIPSPPFPSGLGPDLIPVVSIVSIAPISLIDRNALPGAEK